MHHSYYKSTILQGLGAPFFKLFNMIFDLVSSRFSLILHGVLISFGLHFRIFSQHVLSLFGFFLLKRIRMFFSGFGTKKRSQFAGLAVPIRISCVHPRGWSHACDTPGALLATFLFPWNHFMTCDARLWSIFVIICNPGAASISVLTDCRVLCRIFTDL